jgi:hypothetical protein
MAGVDHNDFLIFGRRGIRRFLRPVRGFGRAGGRRAGSVRFIGVTASDAVGFSDLPSNWRAAASAPPPDAPSANAVCSAGLQSMAAAITPAQISAVTRTIHVILLILCIAGNLNQTFFIIHDRIDILQLEIV